MRIAAVALVAILMMPGLASAQLAPSRTAAPTAPTAAPNTGHPDQFATEADAKMHCSGQNVVWLNTKSHVYHFAGTRDYGHTKQGSYMCQADADKVGRAAKNEKVPTR